MRRPETPPLCQVEELSFERRSPIPALLSSPDCRHRRSPSGPSEHSLKSGVTVSHRSTVPGPLPPPPRPTLTSAASRVERLGLRGRPGSLRCPRPRRPPLPREDLGGLASPASVEGVR